MTRSIPWVLRLLILVTLDREMCGWHRFTNQQTDGSYTGCCPGEHSGGGHRRVGGIDHTATLMPRSARHSCVSLGCKKLSCAQHTRGTSFFRDKAPLRPIFAILLRPYGLAVRTPPFHGGSPGSIPGRVAIPSHRQNLPSAVPGKANRASGNCSVNGIRHVASQLGQSGNCVTKSRTPTVVPAPKIIFPIHMAIIPGLRESNCQRHH